MRIKKSFAFSILLHIGLIGGTLLVLNLPQEEMEEEIVLQLAMSTPETQPASESKPTPPKPPEPQKAQPKPALPEQSQLPIVPKAKVIEPVAESIKTPLQPVIKETPVVQKTEPITKKTEPVPVPVAPPAPAPKQNAEEEYLDTHLSTIRDILVKYRKYPMMAVRLKQEGNVRVSFRLKENGMVEDIRIVEGSGFEMLDQDAMALIEKTASYFPKPPKAVRITVPLSYSLKR